MMIILGFSLFAIIALGLLFGSHYLFYYSLIRFFNIASTTSKVIIFVVLLFLSVSFISATILAHWHDNIFNRYFYLFSGTWLGILWNLLLAVAVTWLIFWLGCLMGFNLNLIIISTLLFVVAWGFSIFGIWNAFHPVIKNVSVTIKDLPENWKGKKIVQLSDVHLGHIYRKEFLSKIVQQINAVQPEAVVITGDLFDGMDGNLNPLSEPLSEITAPEGTFFVTGNHETYLGLKIAFTVLEQARVKILQNEVVDVAGLKIIGISYPERGAASNELSILKTLQPQFLGQPNILLFHTPTNIPQVKAVGVNLQLSGHTHSGQQFPFEFITKWIYKGYDQGLHVLGDFSLYTSVGTGTWGPPLRLGNTPEITVIELH